MTLCSLLLFTYAYAKIDWNWSSGFEEGFKSQKLFRYNRNKRETPLLSTNLSPLYDLKQCLVELTH